MTLINDETVLASQRESRRKLLEQYGGDLMKKVELSYEKHGWLVDGLREFDMAEFQFRVACMAEELSEYTAATTHEDRLDALVDLAVFVVGTALRHGYTKAAWDEAFDRVVMANMEKVAGPVTNQRGESTFDLGKPDGWVAPDLSPIIEALRHGLVIGDGDENRAPAVYTNGLRVFAQDDQTIETKGQMPFTPREYYETCATNQALRRQVGALQQQLRVGHGPALNAVHGVRAEPTMCGLTGEQVIDLLGELERWKARADELEETAGQATDELENIPPIVREAARLCATKSEDYGAKDFAKAEYHPFGHKSYLQMLHTKLTRLRSVAEKEGTNFESARDSLIDLINYAGFYGAWMDLQAGEEAVDKWVASGADEVDDRFGNELDD